MKRKDFDPRFQYEIEGEEYDDDEPKRGGWWRLPVGILVCLALGGVVGGGVYALRKPASSKTAVIESESDSTAETRKTYKKAEVKESKISVSITTDDEKNTDTETVIKLLIKDVDGRTSIDEIEVPLNQLTEVGSLKKGSYILYIMRVPVSEEGTKYTIADNGIRFEVENDGMPVNLEMKLSSNSDGSTEVEVTNSDDAGVTYTYVNTEDYYYETPSQGGYTGGTSGGSSTTPSGGTSTTPSGNGGSKETGDNGGSTVTPSDGGSTGGDGGSTVTPSDGGSTGGDGGSTVTPDDGGSTGGDSGYTGGDGGSTGGDSGSGDGGYTGGDSGSGDGGYSEGGAVENVIEAAE